MARRNKNSQRAVSSVESHSHRKEIDFSTLHMLKDTLQALLSSIPQDCLTDTSDDQPANSPLPKSTSHETFLEMYVNAEKLSAARHRRNSFPDLSKLSEDHISINAHYDIIDKFQEYIKELSSFQKRLNKSIINSIKQVLLQVDEVGGKMEADQKEKHMMRSQVKDQAERLRKTEVEKNAAVERRLEVEKYAKEAEKQFEQQEAQLSIANKDIERLTKIAEAATYREEKLKKQLKAQNEEKRDLEYELGEKEIRINIMRDAMKELAKYAHFGHEAHPVGDPLTWTAGIIEDFFNTWESMLELNERRREILELLAIVACLDVKKVLASSVDEVRLLLDEGIPSAPAMDSQY